MFRFPAGSQNKKEISPKKLRKIPLNNSLEGFFYLLADTLEDQKPN